MEQPQLFREEIKKELQLKDPCKLYLSYPDLFAWWNTRDLGFIRFLKRLKNFFVAKLESPLKERSFMHHFIDLELNSKCNNCCVMGHVSKWPKGKRTGKFVWEPFKEFLDDNLQLTEVKLHGMDEPPLHPDYLNEDGFAMWLRKIFGSEYQPMVKYST